VLNRPVLVIVGSRLPTQKPLLYRVLLHFVLMLEVYGQSRYDHVLLISSVVACVLLVLTMIAIC